MNLDIFGSLQEQLLSVTSHFIFKPKIQILTNIQLIEVYII